MKKVLILMLSILMMLMTGCGDTEKKSASDNKKVETENAAKNSTEKKVGEKILVAYFSRAGDNYEVGVIEKGNTNIVADMIAEKTGADIFEIKPVKPYPAEYEACAEIAKKELAENVRPEIVDKVKNFSDYDTIFLGYPIWWSNFPPVVYTFLESYDWKGKTIIPFCTSGGDYMTGKENDIPHFAKDATIREGIGIRGKRCQDEPEKVRQDVEAWLKNLGF